MGRGVDKTVLREVVVEIAEEVIALAEQERDLRGNVSIAQLHAIRDLIIANHDAGL